MSARIVTCAALVAAVATPAAGASPGPAAPPKLPQMVAWSDPVEHAFTVKVPAGWTITGGTHRNSPIDARNAVAASSPAGTIRVFVDAPNILPRQEPHPAYYALGWYDGKVVQTQAGPLRIEPFRSGAQFAQEYAAVVCPGNQRLGAFDQTRTSAAVTQTIAPVAMQAGVRATASAGEYAFRCAAKSGFIQSVTVLAWTTPQGPHTWAVYKLSGYTADTAQIDLARYVMNAMIASLKIDPQWQAAYERQIHDTTGALMEMSNRITQQSIANARQSLEQNTRMIEQRQKDFDQISAGINGAYQRRQASQDRIAQRRSDTTLGQIHGCDDLGRCSTQSNEYQYHWTAPDGSVVPGPSDGSSPGMQYHPWKPDY